MSGELESMRYRETIVARVRAEPGFCLEGPKKPTENPSNDTYRLVRYLNNVLPKKCLAS
jgi:hypothetical protein